MGVKYENKYCFTCDSYEPIEEGRDICFGCGSHLSDKDCEIEDAIINRSVHLGQMVAYKFEDVINRLEEVEAEIQKIKTL